MLPKLQGHFLWRGSRRGGLLPPPPRGRSSSARKPAPHQSPKGTGLPLPPQPHQHQRGGRSSRRGKERSPRSRARLADGGGPPPAWERAPRGAPPPSREAAVRSSRRSGPVRSFLSRPRHAQRKAGRQAPAGVARGRSTDLEEADCSEAATALAPAGAARGPHSGRGSRAGAPLQPQQCVQRGLPATRPASSSCLPGPAAPPGSGGGGSSSERRACPAGQRAPRLRFSGCRRSRAPSGRHWGSAALVCLFEEGSSAAVQPAWSHYKSSGGRRRPGEGEGRLKRKRKRKMGFPAFCRLAFLSVLLAAPFPRGAAVSFCPRGWLQYQGNCYGYFSTESTWAEAEIACQSYGCRGHLASIINNEEAAEVASYIQTNHQNTANVWIGLHDPQKNREWKWTDDSISSYESWNAGEPHNLKNDCVELGAASGYLLWNDDNCQSKHAFLCMYRL